MFNSSHNGGFLNESDFHSLILLSVILANTTECAITNLTANKNHHEIITAVIGICPQYDLEKIAIDKFVLLNRKLTLRLLSPEFTIRFCSLYIPSVLIRDIPLKSARDSKLLPICTLRANAGEKSAFP